MKNKIITLLIIIALLTSLSVPFVGCNTTDEQPDADYSIAVISDMHVKAESEIGDITSDAFIKCESTAIKMLSLSEAIYHTAVDNIIASNVDAVIVCGDVADDGSMASHIIVAEGLALIEQSGTDVFVIPGNHDLDNNSYNYTSGSKVPTANLSADGFAELYADFGYNEALTYYDNAMLAETPTGVTNLSYTADIGDKYRIIGIDMCYDEMTQELLEWSAQQTEQAVLDGKIPLGAMHVPSMEHLGPLVEALNIEDSKVNSPNGISVPKTLLNAGMHVLFTGHVHMQDIMTYEENGEVLYDIETASTANYPDPIRYFKRYGNEHVLTNQNITSISESYLPDYFTGASRAEVISDFSTYAYKFVSTSMFTKVQSKIDESLFLNILKILGFAGDTEAAEALANQMYNDILLKLFTLPLYSKDVEEGELSVEGIAAEYGKTIPSSKYLTVFDVAMSFLADMNYGDESHTAISTEGVLLKYMLYSAFYLIADFDMFDKIYGEGTFDLMPTMEDLFAQDRLELVENDFLAVIVNNLDIQAILEKVPEFLRNDSRAILGIAIVALSYIKDVTFGIDISEFLLYDDESGLGYIDFDAIINDVLFGELTNGIFNDFGPADNNITIIIN